VRFAQAAATLNPQTINNYLAACFAAGTPIWGEHGSKPIEQYLVGERVWARNENEPNGPLELKAIEERFSQSAPIWHVHVGTQVIRTTDEHPFWILGKGWTRTVDLQIGDMLVGHDGQTNAVEDILETGACDSVYNFRVADHRTYFVGDAHWGFTVWAHNACVQPVSRSGMLPTNENSFPSNGIRVFGTAQVVTTTNHAAAILSRVNQLTSHLRTQGVNPDDVFVIMNRSWRTALNRLIPAGRLLANGPASRLRPDIIVVQRLSNNPDRFRISAYEAWSPSNGDRAQYQQQLINSFTTATGTNSTLVRGDFDVFLP
jgi:hypothetical protein